MASSNWVLQFYSADLEVQPDPTNPLALIKRAKGVFERYCLVYQGDSPVNPDVGQNVGATSASLSAYTGDTEITASSGTSGNWLLVAKQNEGLTPLTAYRVTQRWEAWGTPETYTPA